MKRRGFFGAIAALFAAPAAAKAKKPDRSAFLAAKKSVVDDVWEQRAHAYLTLTLNNPGYKARVTLD